MNTPLLIMFVGIPGSGKTALAKRLAEELSAVILNSDGIRMSMWHSLEAIQATHASLEERKANNLLTFGAMNYAADQILAAGYSVVYDCNANHRYERDQKHAIAQEHGARSVIVRIRVPYDISLRRIQEREVTHDQRQISADKAQEVLDHFTKEIEEPDSDEFTIEISGELPFEKQYETFQQKIGGLG